MQDCFQGRALDLVHCLFLLAAHTRTFRLRQTMRADVAKLNKRRRGHGRHTYRATRLAAFEALSSKVNAKSLRQNLVPLSEAASPKPRVAGAYIRELLPPSSAILSAVL